MWIWSAVSGSFGSAMERLHTAPAARVARGGEVPTDVSLDEGKTAPFELPGDRGACLLLHGFTGSPWDVRPLGEALAQRGYRVRAIRLPGHGTTPEAMAGVSHRDWEAAAESALLSLSGARHTFIAGLSVGALLAVLLAARYPERITGLALIAPALRLKGALVNV